MIFNAFKINFTTSFTMKPLLFTFFSMLFIASFSVHAQTTILTTNSNINKKLLKAEVHSYSVTLEKGQYTECIVMQKGVDLAVDLISPSGKKLKTFDSPNGTNGPETVSIVADEPGNYLLQIYPMVAGQSGISDSASVAKFAEENQGDYSINQVNILSANEYKLKLEKQAAGKVDFTNFLIKNAHAIKTVDAGNGFEDLQAFKTILKDVKVVGLGESSHGTSEFFRMKHRMLEFLVKEMGYNSFYIEASMARCRYINNYVLHGKGNLDTATVIQGFTTWRVEEVRNMIEWIRKYNQDKPMEKKVKFMGYDLQINDVGWKALKQFYNSANALMVPVIDSLQNQSQKAAILSNGNYVAQTKGAELFKKINADCINVLADIALNKGRYEYATGKETYNENLVNIKLIIQEIESFKDGYNDRRDYYMAQNIMELLGEEKPDAKVVVWAHNGHINNTVLDSISFMGHYLSNYLQNKYYAIGFEFYSGSFQTRNLDINNHSHNWDIVTVGEPDKESLPWYFNKVGNPNFYIDFRNTNAVSQPLYRQTFSDHYFGSSYSPSKGHPLSFMNLSDFDGMIYIKTSTAAKNFSKLILQ